MTTLTTPCADELSAICGLPQEIATPRAAAFLNSMVEDPGFAASEVRRLLREAEDAENWYVDRRHEDEERRYSLQVFVWPPRTGTRIHDHASWGVYRCVAGSVLEERYDRLDDGSRLDHARLEKAWQLSWRPEDGCSMVLPGDGGIHRLVNLGGSMAITLHLYGPRTGDADGRDYDPSGEYVCDRLED